LFNLWLDDGFSFLVSHDNEQPDGYGNRSNDMCQVVDLQDVCEIGISQYIVNDIHEIETDVCKNQSPTHERFTHVFPTGEGGLHMLEEEVATESGNDQQVWSDNEGKYFGIETFEKNDQQFKDDESCGQVLQEFPEFWLQREIAETDEHQWCIKEVINDDHCSVYAWWNFHNVGRYQVNNNDLR
jgi:hypothetical protein